MEKIIIKTGSVYIFEFNNNNGHEIQGRRLGIIIGQSKRNLIVVPITSIKNNNNKIAYDEIFIEKNKIGNDKDSKILVGQTMPRDSNKIKSYKLGEIPEDLFTEIKNIKNKIFKYNTAITL